MAILLWNLPAVSIIACLNTFSGLDTKPFLDSQSEWGNSWHWGEVKMQMKKPVNKCIELWINDRRETKGKKEMQIKRKDMKGFSLRPLENQGQRHKKTERMIFILVWAKESEWSIYWEIKWINKQLCEETLVSYRGSRGSWGPFAVLGAGTGMRHGRALVLNSLRTQMTHTNTVSRLSVQ